MSNHTLPSHLNLVKICQSDPKGSHWQGTLHLADLADLPEELENQPKVLVHIDMDCGVDEHGFCVVKGVIQADLDLICQRCMKPFHYPLKASFLVSPVGSDEEAKHIPGQYEPLLVSQGEIDLSTWIAEELYLALPFAPRHEFSCEGYETNNERKGASPFAILKRLG